MKTRFEQSQASVELLLHIRQVIRELHRLFSSIEGTLLDYSHEDNNIELCQRQQGTMEDQKLRYRKK